MQSAGEDANLGGPLASGDVTIAECSDEVEVSLSKWQELVVAGDLSDA